MLCTPVRLIRHRWPGTIGLLIEQQLTPIPPAMAGNGLLPCSLGSLFARAQTHFFPTLRCWRMPTGFGGSFVGGFLPGSHSSLRVKSSSASGPRLPAERPLGSLAYDASGCRTYECETRSKSVASGQSMNVKFGTQCTCRFAGQFNAATLLPFSQERKPQCHFVALLFMRLMLSRISLSSRING